MENKRFWLIDADMTLFDFERCEKAAFARACERCGVPEAAEHDKLYHEINEALWRKLERGLVTQERLRVQRFEEFTAQTGLKADAQAMADSFAEGLAEGCYLFPQALSLLQNLHKKARIAVLTNGISFVQKRRMAYSGLSRYVDALVISEDEGISKPDPRIVLRALEKLGCTDRRQAVIVGDSLTSDLAAAKNARVDGVWYNPRRMDWPEGYENPYLKAEVTQLHDLLRYAPQETENKDDRLHHRRKNHG